MLADIRRINAPHLKKLIILILKLKIFGLSSI